MGSHSADDDETMPIPAPRTRLQRLLTILGAYLTLFARKAYRAVHTVLVFLGLCAVAVIFTLVTNPPTPTPISTTSCTPTITAGGK